MGLQAVLVKLGYRDLRYQLSPNMMNKVEAFSHFQQGVERCPQANCLVYRVLVACWSQDRQN